MITVGAYEAKTRLSELLALVLPDEGESPDRWVGILASAAIDVPDVWHYEVANALIVGVRRERLTSAEAGLAASLLGSLGAKTHPAPPLARLLAVGAAHGLSAYDAAYLVLATDTGSSLLTRDAGLTRAAQASGVPLG